MPRPTIANIALITNIRKRAPTLISKNLYAARVPAKAAKVPSTAWITMPPPYW